MIRRNFFNKLKYLITATLILLLFSIENILAKDPPPGSGSGDVPVNILFLLDNSLSMRVQTIPGDGMFSPWDLVETDNGDIIISQMRRRGLTKINYGTERRDTTFGNNGWFRGFRRDANCGNQDTRLRNAFSMGIDRVNTNDATDDRIYVADHRGRKIVMLNVAGECQGVIWPGFRPISMTVRNIDGTAYLIAAGSNRRRIYSAQLDSDTGMPTANAGLCSTAGAAVWRITHSIGIAMDGQDGTPSFLYATGWGDINRYPLVADGDRFCPQARDVVYAHDNGVASTTSHPAARTIELDPDDDDIIYIATGTHEVTKYEMTAAGLTEVWKQGSQGRGVTDSNANVLFHWPRGLFVGEGVENTGNGNALVYVGSGKPSVQTFDKDHASGQWQNELGGSMGSRMDGAKAAINSIVSEPTLASGASFGYGHWSAGIPGIIGTRAAHRGRGNPDYYTSWDNEHPGVSGSGNSLPCWRGVCIRVGVDRLTNADIVREVNRTPLIFGTDARAFSGLALDYFGDLAVSPEQTDELPCQKNYVIIIGDGAWNSHAVAEGRIETLRTTHGVKTLVVAYGGGVSANGLRNFGLMARAGSCDTEGDDDCVPVILADSPNSLLTQLQTRIEQIVANRLSFTAPSITATIEEGGSLYQAQFDYTQRQEWKGTINRKAIEPNGRLCDLIEDDDGNIICTCGANQCKNNWSAAERTYTIRESRKIWSPLGDIGNYITSDANAWNNWTVDNAVPIGNLFSQLGNEVVDFHRENADGTGSTIQTYCRDLTNDDSIVDGNTDDVRGLINFVRGYDYFNYEPDRGDCVLDKWRSHIIGDIYHSQIVQVGPPNANTAFIGRNQEAFFRASNNYGHYIRDQERRDTLLLAGSNSGMLHAFRGCDKNDSACTDGGQERWAFIPPFIAAKLPKVADVSLNEEGDGGGTNSIFGVDGSPVVHDMFISTKHDCFNAGDECKQWRTIAVIPYGRGGAGYSVLDISEAETQNSRGPKHLFSIYNDTLNNNVLVANHLGTIARYPYMKRSYSLDQSLEAMQAHLNIENADDEAAKDALADCQTEAALTAAGQTFREDGINGCYEGNTWTWSLEMHDNLLVNDGNDQDIQIFLEGELLSSGDYTVNDTGSELTIVFTDTSVKRFRAHEVDDPDDTTATTDATSVEVFIANTSKLALTGDAAAGDEDDADTAAAAAAAAAYSGYAFMGDTWSSPRIFRMPSPTARDNSREDKYVMVMGGGMSMRRGVGSNLFVIDLEDKDIPGRILKVIDIPDSRENRITNATPASPVVVTPDMTPGIPWRGALVYINDFEGKVTKVNLTSMTHGDDGNEINLYDSTQIFNALTDQENARFMYHSMDIAVGRDTNKVWLYMGTGDYEDPNMIPDIDDGEPPIDNVLLGIKDPMSNWSYKNITSPKDLDDCENAEGGTANCPISSSKPGWKIHLANSQKVTAEPTIYQGNVYFPIYQPNADNPCSVGAAFICSADDECGTNNSHLIGGTPSQFGTNPCHFVGFGILSEIVVFAGRLFANIAGLSDDGKSTLVIKVAAPGEADSYRRSWRENF
jgi:type IV pilus assembly protein PilY1